MSDWQPIETAPKDGTPVWLYPHHVCAVWDNGADNWLVWNVPLEPDFTIQKNWSQKPAMWFEVMVTAFEAETTHWRELPADPEPSNV